MHIKPHRSRTHYEVSERHRHELLQIVNKPHISILDVDFIGYRPPYLTDFCEVIDSVVVEDAIDQSEDVLRTIAERFKETVYTEVNFPDTYRPEAKVRLDNDEFMTYRRRYCNYKTKTEIIELRFKCTVFVCFIALIFVLFHTI
jgi:hypothetical protein